MNGQLWGATAIIVLGYIIGSYFQQRVVDSLRKEVDAKIDALRAEIAALRTELRTEIGAARTEIGAARTENRSQIEAVKGELAALRAETKQGFAELLSTTP
jgi:ribosomal protein L29